MSLDESENILTEELKSVPEYLNFRFEVDGIKIVKRYDFKLFSNITKNCDFCKQIIAINKGSTLKKQTVIDLLEYKYENFNLILYYLETDNYPTLTDLTDVNDLYHLANYLGLDQNFLNYVNFDSEKRFLNCLNDLDYRLVNTESKLRELLFKNESKDFTSLDEKYEINTVISEFFEIAELKNSELYSEFLRAKRSLKSGKLDSFFDSFLETFERDRKEKDFKFNFTYFLSRKKWENYQENYGYKKNFSEQHGYNLLNRIGYGYGIISNHIERNIMIEKNIDSTDIDKLYQNIDTTKFSSFYLKVLKSLKYANYVVAGGFLYQQELREASRTHNIDIDVFLVTKDYEVAIKNIQEIHKTLKSLIGDETILISRNANVINFAVTLENFTHSNREGLIQNFYIVFNIQIILRLYNSIVQVISGFDIDSCCIAYDGDNFYAMPRFIRSLIYEYNLADPERQSKNYAQRLVKYSSRGFNIALPGYFSQKITCNFLKPYYEYNGLAKIIKYYMKLKYNNSSKVYLSEHNISDYAVDSFILNEKGIYAYLSQVAINFYKKNNNPTTTELRGFSYQIKYDGENISDDLYRYLSENKIEVPLKVGYDLNYILNSKNTKSSADISNFFESSISDKVTFKTENPGTQKTGSFNPTFENWYDELYLN